ncbi:MAG: hypothetical protein KY449_10340 [Proteobacteria bacterium]|nr:hypothetical protein [Pseudomonadota bacterium]
MNDRVFFSLCALVAIGLIALALVWPQGLGARSPEPFGRPLAQPAPPAPGAAAPPAPAPATPATAAP